MPPGRSRKRRLRGRYLPQRIRKGRNQRLLPPSSEKKTEAPPAKPKITVEKAKPLEEIVEGVVRRVTQEKPVSPPTETLPHAKKTEEDPDAAYIEALGEDQREAIELARYAGKAMPDKYGNMAKRMVDYLKKVDWYIEAKRKEDPDWDPESDEGYSAFIGENQPNYHPGDRKKIERQQILEEVSGDVERKFKPRLDEAERINKVQQLKPEIDKAVDSYEAAIAQRFIPDDKSPFYPVFKAAADKDPTYSEEAWKEAKSVDPLATTIARQYIGQAKMLGREYLELVSGMTSEITYDPKRPPTDPSNQKAMVQQRLFGFIAQQERIFSEQGGDMRTVNGRTFVSRAELTQMPESERRKHWTLGHEDVLDMLAVAAAQQAQAGLTSEIKRLEEAGYVRNGKHEKANKETPASPPAQKKEDSPRAGITPAPGAGNLTPVPSGTQLFTEADLKKQWEGGPALSRW